MSEKFSSFRGVKSHQKQINLYRSLLRPYSFYVPFQFGPLRSRIRVSPLYPDWVDHSAAGGRGSLPEFLPGYLSPGTRTPFRPRTPLSRLGVTNGTLTAPETFGSLSRWSERLSTRNGVKGRLRPFSLGSGYGHGSSPPVSLGSLDYQQRYFFNQSPNCNIFIYLPPTSDYCGIVLSRSSSRDFSL